MKTNIYTNKEPIPQGIKFSPRRLWVACGGELPACNPMTKAEAEAWKGDQPCDFMNPKYEDRLSAWMAKTHDTKPAPLPVERREQTCFAF